MKKQNYLLVMIALMILLGGLLVYRQFGTSKTYPSIENFDFYQIHEIKQNNFSSGSYNTEGFVESTYMCPPCPEGAQCKPCMMAHILIAEVPTAKPRIFQVFPLEDWEMIIFAENPNQFELGKRYRFSINILNYKSTGETINDIDIIGYDLIG